MAAHVVTNKAVIAALLGNLAIAVVTGGRATLRAARRSAGDVLAVTSRASSLASQSFQQWERASRRLLLDVSFGTIVALGMLGAPVAILVFEEDLLVRTRSALLGSGRAGREDRLIPVRKGLRKTSPSL